MNRIIILLLVLGSLNTWAQFEPVAETPSTFSLGLGIGLDYGGIGGRATFSPIPSFGVFGSLGYAIAGVGFNAGLQYRISPDNNIVPVLTAMYGYNAALKVTGAFEVNELYYGPSLGAGVEFKSKRNTKNYFSLELLVPFRDSQFDKDREFYKNLGVEFNDVFPVTISLGYHFGLN
ncbi:MAG: hypothetical protein KF846_14110 [Cyclobacteriaceae bacterium]|nr:hypothetical protein [Cyclobacteriaceae bacterium]MBX2957294.1 hypothetical protein [Cyclobacteriaceae bacterium]